MYLEDVVQSARRLQLEIDKLGIRSSLPQKAAFIVSEDFVGLYDILVKSKELRSATRKLFTDGHYARAVEEAYKCVNNLVKSKSRLSTDGQELMNQVFSEKNPILRLNEFKTKSQKNEQLGYMQIFAGCMTGVRNPRAHEHELQDSPDIALELLAWANHLIRVVHKSKRSRIQKKTTTP